MSRLRVLLISIVVLSLSGLLLLLVAEGLRYQEETNNLSKIDQLYKKMLRRSSSSSSSRSCLTFRERYSFCREIKDQLKSSSARQTFFKRVAPTPNNNNEKDSSSSTSSTSSPQRHEAAILRLHNQHWSPEFWLFVCSFVTEASHLTVSSSDRSQQEQQQQATAATTSNNIVLKHERDVILHVTEQHIKDIPLEFLPFVVPHSEEKLYNHFGKNDKIYKSGWGRGDLAVGCLFRQFPQYHFLWAVEHDVRYIPSTSKNGGWGEMFTRCRLEARKQEMDPRIKYSYLPVGSPLRRSTTSSPIYFGDEKFPKKDRDGYLHDDDAHFISFSEALFWKGYNEEWIWARRDRFHGKYRDVLLGGREWFGLIASQFGLSRPLFEAIWKESEEGNAADMQEANWGVTALLYRLKVFQIRKTPYLDTVVNHNLLHDAFIRNDPTKCSLDENMKELKKWLECDDEYCGKIRNWYIGFKNFSARCRAGGCVQDALFHPVKRVREEFVHSSEYAK